MLELILQFLNSDFAKLVIAFLLALPIAYNREQSTRIMGLRTFPLVALATCGYLLIGQSFIQSISDEARILQGLVAGIGFVGGGAILKKDDKVLGTASAASIWTTGAIGVAVAYARYDVGLFLAGANFVVLRFLTPLKTEVSQEENKRREEAETD